MKTDDQIFSDYCQNNKIPKLEQIRFRAHILNSYDFCGYRAKIRWQEFSQNVGVSAIKVVNNIKKMFIR